LRFSYRSIVIDFNHSPHYKRVSNKVTKNRSKEVNHDIQKHGNGTEQAGQPQTAFSLRNDYMAMK
jgi:hypothetical protein